MKQVAKALATTSPALFELCKRLIGIAARVPGLQDVVVGLLDARSSRTPLGRPHPFDRRYGVATSGAVPGFALIAASSHAYVAAQPSIIRRAFAAIPDVSACHFVDLGCGKGRPLLVAFLCGFKATTGVELSPTLVRSARRNARIMARLSNKPPPLTIVCDDAATFELPKDDLVVFIYNPFTIDIVGRVIKNMEWSLEAAPRKLYVIAYNPVAASLFDASPALERIYAAQLPYAAEEIGFGPDRDDGVVIWCNRGNASAPRSPNRLDRVTVLSPMRAVVESQDADARL